MALDTRVYSPSGELLKAYHGLRGAELKLSDDVGNIAKYIFPTRAYANTSDEVITLIANEKRMNPDLKYLRSFPKENL